MDTIAILIVFLLAAFGHCGLIVWAYNSFNATGWRRTTIKRIEKVILLIGLLLPACAVILELQSRAAGSAISFESLHLINKVYLVILCLFAVVAAPFWIESRPVFSQSRDRSEEVVSHLWKPKVKGECFRGKKFSIMGRLPFNEIGWMEVNRKKLLMDNLPESLHGLTIAHISDIHLTGQMEPLFYRQAFEWLQEARPDVIVLSGDIVDYDRCVEDIKIIFHGLHAPLGKYFVLGNHDRRLRDPLQVSESLIDLGWHDAGKRHTSFLHQGLNVRVVGNELPWFQRVEADAHSAESFGWTLGIAHSPDQFAWGVSTGCGLLLCGHTHGGQIRLPGVGPIVAPSWHGTRYASGVFERNGTIMHVSRGMSGVHPYRWGCPPEVSVLQLADRAS
jgi:predicted MPP superfamily phosphohydrolase